MKKTLVILGLISLFVFTLMRSGSENVPINTNNSSQPKQVIENYFKFCNGKNRQGLLSTLTRWHDQSNVDFGFDNLLFIKLLSIGNNDMTTVNAYLGCGRGLVNGVKPNNVMAYKVTYVSLYSKGPWLSGIQTEKFTLIRENDNAPWLIDDIGQG
ncbi:DUF4829 domain-containing protein [Desulfosporosinus sp. SB140]|uniref:DUF4829 domain-containing protein n=1 Tax=Desulfosporosinus paludis TaxID=3115649 RepID=UPI003890FD03